MNDDTTNLALAAATNLDMATHSEGDVNCVQMGKIWCSNKIVGPVKTIIVPNEVCQFILSFKTPERIVFFYLLRTGSF